MKVEGGCHCGAITYEAEVDPEGVLACHCSDCQTLSGAAFRTIAPVLDGSFRLLSGDPRVYVKIAESGRERIQTFCPTCGTPLYSGTGAGTGSAPGSGIHGDLYLRVGTIRQRDRLAPKGQIWCRSEQSWLGGLGTIPRARKQEGLE